MSNSIKIDSTKSKFSYGVSSTASSADMMVAYRDDQHVLMCDDSTLTPYSLGDFKTSKSPGVVVDSNRTAFIVCREDGGSSDDGKSDETIFLTSVSLDGRSYTEPEAVVDNTFSSSHYQPTTDFPPALCKSSNGLSLAYKHNHKHVVGWAEYNGSSWSLVDNGTVKDDKGSQHVYGAITNNDSKVKHSGISIGDKVIVTDRGPSISYDGSNSYLALKSHGRKYFYVGTTTTTSDPDSWSFNEIADINGDGNPAICYLDGYIYFAYFKGQDHHDVKGVLTIRKWLASDTGTSWGDEEQFLDQDGNSITTSKAKQSYVTIGTNGTGIYVSWRSHEDDYAHLNKLA